MISTNPALAPALCARSSQWSSTPYPAMLKPDVRDRHCDVNARGRMRVGELVNLIRALEIPDAVLVGHRACA